MTVRMRDTQLSSEAERAMTKLKHEVVNRRLRVHEFFVDFDPLRKGFVSPAVFRRNLRTLLDNKFKLSEEDVQAVIAAYSTGDSPTEFCWMDWADDVDSVFTVKHLEENPRVRPGNTFDFVNTVRPQDREKPHVLQSVLDQLQHGTATQRILTKPQFQPFDKHNRGMITVQQFRRVLSFALKIDLSEEEFAEIARYYGSDDGLDIRYLDFCYDIDKMDDNW
eukprot:Rmarinus@m.24293